MRTKQPGYLKAANYRGLHRYFLTFCTDRRRRFFVDAESVDLVLSQILRAAGESQFAIVADRFMPDHVHLLVEGTTDNSDCLALISKSKQYSGFYFSKTFGQKLWQRYGFEHVLRNDQATLDIARYILANPVRAGLAADPRDYPFTGSQTHTIEAILEAVADTGPA